MGRFLLYSGLLHLAVVLALNVSVFSFRAGGNGRLPPVEVSIAAATAPARRAPPSVRRQSAVRPVAPSPADLADAKLPAVAASAPPAGGPAGGGGAAGSGASEGFRSQLWAAIEGQKEYPTLARARHQTGRVLVGFTLRKDGRITDVRLAKPCEFMLLNQAAVETLSRLDHFQPIPDAVSAGDLAFTIPLVFKLQN